ncbi:MAG: hypothetical protein JSV49_08350 [Thermoplasmata archaeon]|nr:MAG: hypothetical protein JSV49_08350 [Thermoplasmata archaeon]
MPDDATGAPSSRENLAPEVAITAPDHQATVSGTITVNGTASDDVLVKHVKVRILEKWYNCTDTSGNDTWYTWNYSLNTKEYEEGWLRIVAYASDGEKGADAFIDVFIKNNASDNIKPKISIETPGNNTEVSGWINIRGHATDNGPIKSVVIIIDGKEHKAWDTSGNHSWYKWVLEFNTSKLKNGKYNVTARAYDGKNFGEVTIVIHVNNTAPPKENHPPNIVILHPKNEATVWGTIAIKGKAWDVDGKIVKVQVKIGDVYYNAKDTSGNGTWYYWQLDFDTKKLKNGEHKVLALATDNGSKLGDDSIWIVVKNPENHPPNIQITHPANEAKVSGLITIKGKAWDVDGKVVKVQVRIAEVYYNATDTSGNGTWYYWKLDFNTTKLKNGEWKVTALATDNLSKLGETHIWIIINNPENMAPHITITHPANEAKVSGVITIKGKAWDTDGKVVSVKVRIFEVWYNATDISGNSSWYYWKLIFNTSKLKDGEYKITAIAYDNQEKAEDTHIWILVKNTKENHWPFIEILHPKNEATVSGVITISGKAWDIDGKVVMVQVRIAEVYYNATDTSGNGTWYTWKLEFNTTKLKDGEYKVTALAKDNGGKLGDDGIWILIKNEKENMAPHIEITHPANEAKVSGVITIKGKAWDMDGKVVKVRIRIYDVWYDATDTSGNGSWYTWKLEFNTTKLYDGEYKITAVAYDDKEKAGDAHRWIIVKNGRENYAPRIEITHPENEIKVKGVITIKGKAWDVDGNITKVRIRIGEIWYHAKDNTDNDSWYYWSFEYNTTKLKNGWYKIIAAAYDGYTWGDDHISLYFNNEVDRCPKVEITSPKSSSRVSGNVKIIGKAWDDKAVKSVQIKIGDKKFNAIDTSGNNTWYTWKFSWRTKEYKSGEYRITAIVYDGNCYEDTHIWVLLKNPSYNKSHKHSDDDKKSDSEINKDKKKERLPGFEGPIALVAAAIAVVVASFFRNDRSRV